MKKAITKIMPLAALLITVPAFAEEQPYNCQAQAQLLGVPTINRDFTLVREWDEDALGYYWEEDEKGVLRPTVPKGGAWLDGYTGVSESNFFGVCWLKFEMTKGRNYVLTTDASCPFSFMFTKASMAIVTPFGGGNGRRMTIGDKTYYYISASDWPSYEADKITYYLRVFGGFNTVGRKFTLSFEERSIQDYMPADTGSLKNPKPLDVTHPGTEIVPKCLTDEEGYSYVAYKAQLKANVEYKFFGSDDGYRLLTFALINGQQVTDIPGTFSFGDDLCSNMVVRVSEDYTLQFRVWGFVHTWDVSAMSFSWTGEDGPVPEPQPLSGGTYAGTLLDQNRGKLSVDLSVIAKLMDDGTTNFTATVVANCQSNHLYDAGAGTMRGSWMIGTKEWQSFPQAKLISESTLQVAGSLFVEDNGEAVELHVGGNLPGAQVMWEDSFLRLDPETMSARDVGITSGAFKDEPAKSPELVKLQGWGARNNVEIRLAGSIEFSAAGDPSNPISSAYLLDCIPSQEAVEAESAKFVITAFDWQSGTVTVAGDKIGGQSYGNGTVQIRTSATVDGTYDTETKSGSPQLFYRAYLVR